MARQALAFHILPVDGIGGAEVAAKLGASESSGRLRVLFLRKSRQRGNPIVRLGALLQGSLLAFIELRRQAPKAVIFSLWESVFAMLLCALFAPGVRRVLFFHSAAHGHFFDKVASSVMVKLCHEVWLDCPASKTRLGRDRRPYAIISMLGRRIESCQVKEDWSPAFISWCRLAREKRIDRSLQLIAELTRRHPNVSYTIIGPDNGQLTTLKELSERLGLRNVVKFVGPLEWVEIQRHAERATFYLQLSEFEGFGMAVAEAMQLGLIPVVTPVGEINSYCTDRWNAIIHQNVRETAERITNLLEQPTALAKTTERSRQTFESICTYSEDVNSQLERIIREDSSVGQPSLSIVSAAQPNRKDGEIS